MALRPGEVYVRTTFIFAACAALLTSAAIASTGSANEDAKAAAMAKCMADTSALGAQDAEEGCTCFVDRLSDEEASAYAQITDWDRDATPSMKQAGAACFPELQ